MVANRNFAFHVGNVIGDDFHWTRAVERYHGYHVLDGFRLHLHQIARHSSTFKLEEPRCVSLTDIVINFRVINWYVAEVQFFIISFFNKFAGFGHNGQRGQS